MDAQNDTAWQDTFATWGPKKRESSGLECETGLQYNIFRYYDRAGGVICSYRQVSGDAIFYKYHGKNRLGSDFDYVTNKKYTSETELRKYLAILT